MLSINLSRILIKRILRRSQDLWTRVGLSLIGAFWNCWFWLRVSLIQRHYGLYVRNSLLRAASIFNSNISQLVLQVVMHNQDIFGNQVGIVSQNSMYCLSWLIHESFRIAHDQVVINAVQSIPRSILDYFRLQLIFHEPLNENGSRVMPSLSILNSWIAYTNDSFHQFNLIKISKRASILTKLVQVNYVKMRVIHYSSSSDD